MGLRTTCDGCGRVVVGIASGLHNVNGRYLCASCASNKNKYYCNTCHNYVATAIRKGNGWIELILYLFYIVPGVIYSIWRRTGSPNICTVCKSPTLVPAGAAKPQEIPIHDSNVQTTTSQETNTKKCPSCAELIKAEAIKCRFCGERFDLNDVAQHTVKAGNGDCVESRIPCPDGACVGVIGANGRCGVCGRQGEPTG